MNKNKLRVALILIVGLGVSALIAFAQIRGIERQATASTVVADNFGGPFELTDHTGRAVTEKDFSGQWRLMYFGFTFCPAICPTELAKMTEVLNALGEKGEQITPIFITIDPERDTQKIMADYVSLFHPRLIGLTGTPDQIAEIAKAYKVYYAKVDDPTLSEYTMDHSSYIYLIDPQDNLHALYKIDQTADEVIADISARL